MAKDRNTPSSKGQGRDPVPNIDRNQQQQQSPNAPKYKKVFIQRDYSQGTAVRFQTNFPPELEGYVEPETFHYLINNINQMYSQGEAMSGRAFCESCCACLSAYFLYMCVEPYYDKCARKVGDFIEEQNDLRWKRKGLHVTDPLERGLRVIEITIFLDKVPQRPQQPQQQSQQQQQPQQQQQSHQPASVAATS